MSTDTLRESRERLVNLLQDLFLFDSADLDFGIFRIMNFKRKEIERFMQEDLIEAVEQKTFELSKKSESLLENELEALASKINEDFGEGTIDKQGRVQKHKDAPKMQQYLLKQ